MKDTNLPVKNKSVNSFITKVKGFLPGAAGTNRGELQEWFEDDFRIVKRSYKAIKKEQEVCTIMHSHSPQMLNSFFVVPKLNERSSSQEVSLRALVLESLTNGVLISGRLGQGKSMLLRYLHFLELNIGTSIPLFLNLHSIKTGSLIKVQAASKLNELGLKCSNKLFDYLLSNGFVKLFLDGYDEILFDKRAGFDSEIKNILKSVDHRVVFLTSRFDTNAERYQDVTQYTIQPLNQDEQALFIKKVLKNDGDQIDIMRKLGEAREFDASVLDSPLLLTWFIMVYKVRRKIPKTKLGFYEELFKTILSRHDGIKGSFDRPSKSKLADDEIEKILHAFCYITSKEQESSFDESTILARITKAINISKLNGVSAKDYLYDLTHITCLLVKDGINYSFIHDSIQSYFGACFVRNTTEKNSKIFYKKANVEWRDWEDELNFLFHLDSYRFNSFLIKPSILSLSSKSKENGDSESKIEKVSSEFVKELYSKSFSLFIIPEGGDAKYSGSYYMPAISFAFYFIFNDANLEICETDRRLNRFVVSALKKDAEFLTAVFDLVNARKNGNSKVYLELNEVLRLGGKVNAFFLEMESFVLEKINNALVLANDSIAAETQKESLF